MSINRFGQVISVEGFNEDGKILSDALDIKYKNYADAIEQIFNNDTIAALLSNNEVMTITVIGPDGQQTAKIFSGVKACAAKQGNTHCYFMESDEFDAAHELGLSCGKYRAFLELQLLDPDITPETVRGMTMREIRELANSLSPDGEDSDPPCTNRKNGHRGNGCGWGKKQRR